MTGQRQHTIPSFYLDRFLAPGWVYRKGSASPRRVHNSRDVSVHPDYYGRAKNEGFSLDEYNTLIENEAAPSLRKLTQDPGSLMARDWGALSYLFANLYVRTPAQIEETRRWELEVGAWMNELGRSMVANYEEQIATAKARGEDLSRFELPEPASRGLPLDEWNEHFARVEAEGGHREVVSGMFIAMSEIAGSIRRMGFQLWRAPKGLSYVSSDWPLRLVNLSTDSPAGIGWDEPQALGAVALSPTRYLCMSHLSPALAIQIVDDTRDGVAFFNERTIAYARSEVYGRHTHPLANRWMRQ